ncbi:Phospholipase/carboxylesterase/thioesterase [Cryptosporidium tyzzeri]|nr:Phospholipase/carboxylesterase/thioesterase [Cryptosporidium tyzzeri]
MKLITFLFIIIIKVVYSKNSTIYIEKNDTHNIPSLTYYSPLIFFSKDQNSLIHLERTLKRLKLINKNLKEKAKSEALNYEDPYLNPERFTKSKIWRFFNYFKLKRKKKKKPRHPGKIAKTFSFEEYLILNYHQNLNFTNQTDITTLKANETYYYGINQTIQDNETTEFNSCTSTKCHSLDNFDLYSNSVTPGDYSSILEIFRPRRPKNIIITLLGVSSDQIYLEAFKYTYYPFISQMKMYGEQFRKDTGIIFVHPFLRKFKPIGSIKWVYRYAWADFAFGIRLKQVNLKQWMYSVESVIMLINYLIEVEKYDPKRIFIYGYSQGGALSLSVTLRTKYVLGGLVSTASFLAERAMKRLISMDPLITNEGLKTPILLTYCNPDFVFPFRSAKKDIKYLLNNFKANIKNTLMLGEGHSCLTKYSMVYIDWIYSVLSNYKDSNYKPKEFSYKLLDINNDFQEFYNFGSIEEKKSNTQ